MPRQSQTGSQSGSSAVPALSLLPAELWTSVFADSSFGASELKKIRLVAQVFADVVTPLLFRKICYSITERGIADVDDILASKSLRKHVTTLIVDTAVYKRSITTKKYAADASQHFADNPALKGREWSADKLELVLRRGAHEQVSGCMPPEFAKQFFEGFGLYHAAAEFQHNYFSSNRFSLHLAQTMTKLPALRHVKLQRSWQLSENRPLKVLSLYTDPGSRSRIASCQDWNCLFSMRLQPMLLTMRGWVFSGPGRTARSMYPLHLPPDSQEEMELQPKSSIPHRLLRALSHSRVQIESLVFPTKLEPCSNTIMPDHVTIHALASAQKRLLYIVSPIEYAFYHLKHLELSLTTFAQTRVHRGRYTTDHNWIPSALRRMRRICDLTIKFEWYLAAFAYEIYKLILETTPGRDNQFTCHCDATTQLDINNTKNDRIWLPSEEIAGYRTVLDASGTQPSNPGSRLSFITGISWPNLRKLSLTNISATKHDIASLMLIVAPTLRDLTLVDILIRDCPCVNGEPREWRTQRDDVADVLLQEHWYEVATMLNNALRLDACVINSRYHDLLCIKIMNMIKCTKAESEALFAPSANTLGRYLVEAPSGQSLAVWLINERATEEAARSEGKKRKLDEMSEE